MAEQEQKPVQIDLYHLQHGEIRPLSTYIPQELDVHRCLQTGNSKDLLIIPKKVEKNFKGDRVCTEIMSTLVCGITNNDVIKEPDKPIVLDLYNHTAKTDGVVQTLSNPCHNSLRIIDKQNIISPTITTELSHSTERTFTGEKFFELTGQLRRLTPKECFRLMGFLNDEINLTGLSDNQSYDLAGDGWDVNLVSKIFKKMFPNEVKKE